MQAQSPSTQSRRSKISCLASLSESDRQQILRRLGPEIVEALRWDWRAWARPSQLPPGSPGAEEPRQNWIHWIPLAGRGWGKTRVGAETVRIWAEQPNEKIHLVGPTASAVRSVMIEGPSGLMQCYPPYRRPDYQPSRHMIHFPSGAVAETFSADEPERLRGPQCSKYWADEPCAWRFLDEAWQNLMYGYRLGDNLRGICTTTPKPLPWLRSMLADPGTVATRHSTYENRANLAGGFFASVVRKYEGTRLGRQELLAEILEDTPGALWHLAMIERYRVARQDLVWDGLVRVVVGIDPAVSNSEGAAETGMVVAGLTANGHVLVMEDASCKESPLGWANVALAAFKANRGDRIIAEINNGGNLVEANIRAVWPAAPLRVVHASRGKAVRAEPVASLYEQGRVHHIGRFAELEEQMCNWVPDMGGRSPDRMDALVWALTDLVIDPEREVRYQQIMPPVIISRY